MNLDYKIIIESIRALNCKVTPYLAEYCGLNEVGGHLELIRRAENLEYCQYLDEIEEFEFNWHECVIFMINKICVIGQDYNAMLSYHFILLKHTLLDDRVRDTLIIKYSLILTSVASVYYSTNEFVCNLQNIRDTIFSAITDPMLGNDVTFGVRSILVTSTMNGLVRHCRTIIRNDHEKWKRYVMLIFKNFRLNRDYYESDFIEFKDIVFLLLLIQFHEQVYSDGNVMCVAMAERFSVPFIGNLCLETLHYQRSLLNKYLTLHYRNCNIDCNLLLDELVVELFDVFNL
jgi:hypothetical protein